MVVMMDEEVHNGVDEEVVHDGEVQGGTRWWADIVDDGKADMRS